MTIYREFTLHTSASWQPVVALVKANAQACIDANTPLRIIITTEERKRNTEQNRYLWGVVYKAISEQAWVGNKLFSKDVWHELFARRYGICEDMTLPDGEVIIRRKSTADMTVSEFSEFLENVKSDAANNLGVIFE